MSSASTQPNLVSTGAVQRAFVSHAATQESNEEFQRVGSQPKRGARRLTAFALGLTAMACVAGASAFRAVEVWLCRRTFPMVGLGPTYADQTDFFKFFASGTGDSPTRFTITPQCSALLLCVPLILVAAMIVLSANSSVRRTCTMLIAAGFVLIIANQVRLAVIGWTIRLMGFERGFPLSHLVLGTIVSLLGVAGSIAFLIRMSRRPDRLVA